MTQGSLEGFCDDVRRLASACVSVEQWGRSDRAPHAAPPNPAAPAFLAGSSPETHAICELAGNLRQRCERFLEGVPAGARVGTPGDARPGTILVVDDVADTRDLLTAVLGEAGFDVATAANGLEGLLAAHQCRPSLIVMDVQMPILDGIEATRLLKANEATRHIPVLAHTARPDSCHVPPGVLFEHVLPKPVIPDVLLAWAHRCVGQGDGAA